jgi:2-dehydropantoate 2-reductase
MRILVVGAGAIGGYFGGRLLNAGRDVTFLVRPRRAAELANTGLVIRSRLGDVNIAAPPIAMAEALRSPFDLILLSCKAYDLTAAMDSFAPAVGADSAILPLLNGIGHLDMLTTRFGDDPVLGGLCMISTALDADGRVLHLSDMHALSFGERNGAVSARAQAIAEALSGARFDSRLSASIMQDMWEKWVFIATGAGITCLMRGTVGDIVAAGGTDLTLALLDECAAIAAAQGFPPSDAALARSRTMFTAPGSALAASMLRDVERGGPTEADHVLGDLLRRGEEGGIHAPLLGVAYAHLKSYEARRAREIAARQAA